MKWYQLDEKEVFKRFQTSEEGLSEAHAKKYLETYGPNKIAEKKETNRPDLYPAIHESSYLHPPQLQLM